MRARKFCWGIITQKKKKIKIIFTLFLWRKCLGSFLVNFPHFILMYNACSIPWLCQSKREMKEEVVLHLLYLRNDKSCLYFHWRASRLFKCPSPYCEVKRNIKQISLHKSCKKLTTKTNPNPSHIGRGLWWWWFWFKDTDVLPSVLHVLLFFKNKTQLYW